MKKALLDGLRICEVRAEAFPVASSLRWVDCADDVTPETHTFDGLIFIAKPVPATKTQDELAAEAIDRLERMVFEINFDQENRVRALELKLPITRAQYRDALIARWRQING